MPCYDQTRCSVDPNTGALTITTKHGTCTIEPGSEVTFTETAVGYIITIDGTPHIIPKPDEDDYGDKVTFTETEDEYIITINNEPNVIPKCDRSLVTCSGDFLVPCVDRIVTCAQLDEALSTIKQTQVSNGSGSLAAENTYTANHFGTYPNETWRTPWMTRDGDVVTVNVWNPEDNRWDSFAIEAPENLVVLNNPVIYLRETGSANPPIETQDDLTVANAFNSMNAIRNFLSRSLVVGTVTVDGRGSYEGGTGVVGPGTFKNAQNIVVRGDPNNPSALEFKRTNAVGSVAVASGGGNVTFRDMTVRVDTTSGGVTGPTTARNYMIVAGSDTTLNLRGTIRFVGTGNTDHYPGGALYGYGAQQRGVVNVNGAKLEFSMAPAHKFEYFIYAVDEGTVGFGANTVLDLQTTLIANNFIRINQGSTFNGYSYPDPPPAISGSGQLDVTNVFSVQNLAFIKSSSWDLIAGPGSGWPTVAPVNHQIADYSVWNGVMGMDL